MFRDEIALTRLFLHCRRLSGHNLFYPSQAYPEDLDTPGSIENDYQPEQRCSRKQCR